MPRDMTFEAIKLLSQRIVSNADKIPEGIVFQKTSCMNMDDAELVGLCLALKKRIALRGDKKRLERLDGIVDMLEIMGISRWQKGELTHLGFRAGLRYQEVTDVARDSEEKEPPVVEQSIDEAGLTEGQATTQ